MAEKLKVLAIAGSARNGSVNRKLIRAAAAIAMQQHGIEVAQVDPEAYELPLYNGDLESEQGLPEAALKLKQLFLQHDALLFASPEYNSSISPYLKNIIDWVSRPAENEESLACYKGKVAGLLAASPGALGGLRGLVHLRSILSNISVIVVPQQAAIGGAYEAFDDSGNLKQDSDKKRVTAVVESLVKTARGFKLQQP